MGSYTKDLHKLAARYGFSVGLTKGNHFELTHEASGKRLFASLTPRNQYRTLRNIEGDIKRLLRALEDTTTNG